MRARICVLYTLELAKQGSGPQEVARRVLTEIPKEIHIMAITVNAATVDVMVGRQEGLENFTMDFFKGLERSQALDPSDFLDPSND